MTGFSKCHPKRSRSSGSQTSTPVLIVHPVLFSKRIDGIMASSLRRSQRHLASQCHGLHIVIHTITSLPQQRRFRSSVSPSTRSLPQQRHCFYIVISAKTPTSFPRTVIQKAGIQSKRGSHHQDLFTRWLPCPIHHIFQVPSHSLKLFRHARLLFLDSCLRGNGVGVFSGMTI